MPPHRPRGHGRPQGANHIDLRYSADALKAISDLQLGSRPRAILKFRPPSSLDYKACQGPQTGTIRMHLCNERQTYSFMKILLQKIIF